MDAPLDNLTRQVDFTLERADSTDDGLTLEGYAAVFDTPTTIDSFEGRFTEQIARGSFRKTLRERMPVLQFDHGKHPLVGSLPLGSIDTLREDGHGLFVRARLHDNWLVEPVRDAIKSGAISGMSFRFSVVREAWQEPAKKNELPSRTITEAKLYELGPVVFPAYADTSVGVRAQELAADPDFRRELARALVAVTDLGDGDDRSDDEDRTSEPMREPDGGSIGEDAASPAVAPPDDGHPAANLTLTMQRRLALLRPMEGLT